MQLKLPPTRCEAAISIVPSTNNWGRRGLWWVVLYLMVLTPFIPALHYVSHFHHIAFFIFCDDCYPIFFTEEVPELLSRYNTLRDALEELLQLNREVNIYLQNRLHFRLYTKSIRFSDFRIILCSYSSLISPSVYLAREWDWWISYKITNFQNCDAK